MTRRRAERGWRDRSHDGLKRSVMNAARADEERKEAAQSGPAERPGLRARSAAGVLALGLLLGFGAGKLF